MKNLLHNPDWMGDNFTELKTVLLWPCYSRYMEMAMCKSVHSVHTGFMVKMCGGSHRLHFVLSAGDLIQDPVPQAATEFQWPPWVSTSETVPYLVLPICPVLHALMYWYIWPQEQVSSPEWAGTEWAQCHLSESKYSWSGGVSQHRQVLRKNAVCLVWFCLSVVSVRILHDLLSERAECRNLACDGKKGLLTRLISVMKKEPVDSSFRWGSSQVLPFHDKNDLINWLTVHYFLPLNPL